MADAAPAPTSGDRPLRLITWNVNGLASHCRGGGGRSLAALVAGLDRAGGDGTPVDVVCVQETKLRRCELTADLGQLPGWWACPCVRCCRFWGGGLCGRACVPGRAGTGRVSLEQRPPRAAGTPTSVATARKGARHTQVIAIGALARVMLLHVGAHHAGAQRRL